MRRRRWGAVGVGVGKIEGETISEFTCTHTEEESVMTLSSSQPHAIKPAPTEGPNSFILRFTLLSHCAPFMFVNAGEVNRGKDEISASDWRRMPATNERRRRKTVLKRATRQRGPTAGGH